MPIRYRDIGVVGAFAIDAEKIAEQRQKQTANLLSAQMIDKGAEDEIAATLRISQ